MKIYSLGGTDEATKATKAPKFKIEGVVDRRSANQANQGEQTIIIPSQLYPLSGTPELFYHDNTENIEDKQLQDIFNRTEASIGFCYQNTESLAANLKAAGIPKQRYRTYAGWLFIGDEHPIHHAFIVVDNKHILDFSVGESLQELEKELSPENLTLHQLKEKMAEEFIRKERLVHSERATFGQVASGYIYIASPCKPSQARKIFQRLIRSHPNHPCHRNTGKYGETDMQLRIIKKKIAQEGKGEDQ